MALFIVLGYAMNAQKLSLTPQVGFENSRTSVNFNNLGSFAPLGGEFSPQVSLRLDYKFKQGFGPYIGVSTSRSVVQYSFSDIENGMNLYSASNGNMQLRMEAGYQFTTKPILFNKVQSNNGSVSKSNSSMKGHCGSSGKYAERSSSSCSKSYSFNRSHCSKSSSSSRGHCGNKSSMARKAQSKNNGGWVKLQPSVGIGFIPSPQTDVITKTQGGQTTYEYRAGNWNTALQTGVAFEFGRKQQRLATVSFNYFTGIGNMKDQTIAVTSGSKTSVAHLESKASGFNVRVGVPFSLTGSKTSPKKKHEYRSRGCSERKIIEYKYRCRSI